MGSPAEGGDSLNRRRLPALIVAVDYGNGDFESSFPLILEALGL